MIASENIKMRQEMVIMHNEYLQRLEESMNEKNYIEASWLCYAIIEQRINRLIEKHIKHCPKKINTKGYPVSINTRLKCIQNLIKLNYNGCGQLDYDLFLKSAKWCKNRNNLTHDLVNLKKYKKYDEEFKQLAVEGFQLVKKLYKEISKYRNWWYKSEECLERFPYDCKNQVQCLKIPNTLS